MYTAPAYWVGDGSCDDGAYAYGGNQIDVLDLRAHTTMTTVIVEPLVVVPGLWILDRVAQLVNLRVQVSEIEEGVMASVHQHPSWVMASAITLQMEQDILEHIHYTVPPLNWDDGDCPDPVAAGCSTGEVLDCSNNCVNELLLGDGTLVTMVLQAMPI